MTRNLSLAIIAVIVACSSCAYAQTADTKGKVCR